MEGASTIFQLKEELRIQLLDLVFLCETKNKKSFVKLLCKKLKGITSWEIVEPRGFSGGLLLGWSDKITVRQVISTDFYFEVQFKVPGLLQNCWGGFCFC